MDPPGSVPEGPPRRRAPWSFKSLVEDVSGRPLADFQEPGRDPHGARPVGGPGPTHGAIVAVPASAVDPLPDAGAETELDPVARIYPPLAGSTGRSLHGSAAEHHAETLRSVEGPQEGPSPGARSHRPGPSRRPERIYLHYLLLHLDRLNDGALRYLQRAVDEEVAHREPPPKAAPPEAPPREAPPPEVPPPVPVAP